MVQRYSQSSFSAKPAGVMNELLPILSADHLLATNYRQDLLARIERLSAAPKDHYQVLYANLITRFAAFVQQLPNADHIEFALLDYHLGLCDTALALRIPFMTQETTWTISQQQEALWHYVIFSSALLHNVGRLVTRYSVGLCNEKGHFITAWEPFLSSMGEQEGATHYRIQQILHHDPTHTAKVNQLLAMHLMPRDGFLWIASDPDALAAWLEAVEGQAGSGGFIMRLLLASEKELFKRAREKRLLTSMEDSEHLDHIAKKLDIASHELIGLAPPLHGKLSKDTEIGEAFLNWLKQGLHSGEIAVNTANAMVHMTEDGVFLLYPPIFESFSKAYPRFRDWAVVYRQFNYLGLAPLSGSDFVFAKYFSEHSDVTAQKIARQSAATGSSKFSSLFKAAVSEHMPTPNQSAGQVGQAVAQAVETAQAAAQTAVSQNTQPISQIANIAATAAQGNPAGTIPGLLVDPKFLFAQHMPPISSHVEIQHQAAVTSSKMNQNISAGEASRHFFTQKAASHQAITSFFARLQNSQYPPLRFAPTQTFNFNNR